MAVSGAGGIGPDGAAAVVKATERARIGELQTELRSTQLKLKETQLQLKELQMRGLGSGATADGHSGKQVAGLTPQQLAGITEAMESSYGVAMNAHAMVVGELQELKKSGEELKSLVRGFIHTGGRASVADGGRAGPSESDSKSQQTARGGQWVKLANVENGTSFEASLEVTHSQTHDVCCIF